MNCWVIAHKCKKGSLKKNRMRKERNVTSIEEMHFILKRQHEQVCVVVSLVSALQLLSISVFYTQGL